MEGVHEKEIGDILLEAGLLSLRQLKEYRELSLATGEKLEKILLSEGMINYREILQLLAKKMGVEFVDLESTAVNRAAVEKLAPEIVKRYGVFPFEIRNNFLFLAMQTPDDIFLLDDLKLFAQMEIKPFLADNRLIGKAIEYFYSSAEGEAALQGDHKTEVMRITEDHPREDGLELKQIQALVPKEKDSYDEFVRNVVLKAVKINAYQIHLDLMGKAVRIRYRVDGRLLMEDQVLFENNEEFISRIKIMSGVFTSDQRFPQRGRIILEVNSQERIHLGVLVLPTVSGDRILFELDRPHTRLSLDELGFTESERDQIKGMLNRKSGLIIVTAPVKNGRTTTAYALLNQVISPEFNVITLEKSVFQKVEGISQIEVGDRGADEHGSLLEAALESDPDILLTDMELNGIDLKLLINTALGGKLVILTMNFTGIFETLSGLLNMGFEPYQISASVEGIIAQNLLRRTCSQCKNKVAKTDFGNQGSCICYGTGYKGKVALFEVFSMNKEYRKILLKGYGLEELEQKLEAEKSSYKSNCLRLINQELTSIDEIIRLGIGKDLLSF